MELPLLSKTPAHWADNVFKDPIAFLSDHAFLERKAASNALQLINRWPEPGRPDFWEKKLSSIARDEGLHLNQVIRHLEKRGGKMARGHRNQYATDLHELIRKGQGKLEILDRLLVSALIEARSCERFAVLGKRCPDEELAGFYRRLYASEKTHYRDFMALAEAVVGEAETKVRWKYMLEEEAKILERQETGPRMHSGVPNPTA